MLALVSRFLSSFNQNQSAMNSSIQTLPKPKPIVKNTAQKTDVNFTYERQFGELPRRIRRLQNLAREAGYTKGVQIEHQHWSGILAQKFCKLYDTASEKQKRILENKPMHEVWGFINRLNDQGRI